MKKLLLSASFFIVLPFSIATIYAQDFTFDRALSDFIYTLDQYRTAHRQYQLKKAEYLKFNTLTSQTDAQAAGLDMLLKRDDVIRTHLTALRLKLAETPGVNPTDRESLYARIDQEVNWLYLHQNRLQNAVTLSELTRISKEVETRYSAIQILVYQTLTTILAGKQTNLRNSIQDEYSQLNSKIAQIKASGENTQLLERWLVQASQRLDLSRERQVFAEISSTKLTPQTRNLDQKFLDIQFALKESHQYLKETVSALQEIIKEIKS